jgi:aminoglycoside N3'-acetyltransferase
MADSFSRAELDRACDGLGVSAGDTVMVHASLLHLGRMDGVALADIPRAVIAALRARIGREGTLAMLAPFYDYADKGILFDTRTSPVARQIGVLSAAFAAMPTTQRSANPIFALCAEGPAAEAICNASNGASFGSGSAWERLMEGGPKILMLGCGIATLTLVRLIEQRAGVPYLYTKLFATPVSRDGVTLDLKVTALLRYRAAPITYALDGFASRLAREGILREEPLGADAVRLVDARSCVGVGTRMLAADPYAFLAAPPAYTPGELPLI